MTNKEIHQALIKKQGTTVSIKKAIEELDELIRPLQRFLTISILDADVVNPDELKMLFDEIKEERADVENVLDKINEVFHFQKCEIEDLKRAKMVRTASTVTGEVQC